TTDKEVGIIRPRLAASLEGNHARHTTSHHGGQVTCWPFELFGIYRCHRTNDRCSLLPLSKSCDDNILNNAIVFIQNHVQCYRPRSINFHSSQVTLLTNKTYIAKTKCRGRRYADRINARTILYSPSLPT